MLKRVCTYTFILLMSLSIILGNAETITPESAVIQAYEESGSDFEEVNINSHVILGKFITIDNAEEICNDIAERLNLTEVTLNRNNEEGLLELIMYGFINNENPVTIIVQSTQYQDFQESTIVLDIIVTKGEYDLRVLCDKIRNILSSYGKVIVNITLTGSYDMKLKPTEQKVLVDKVFKAIKAKEVEGIIDDNIVSISGHTQRVMEHISYNNNKVNINIALRYNSFEEKTNIWIGTPLIVTEY